MLNSPWASGGRTGQPGVERIRQPRKFHRAAPVSSLEQPQVVETVAHLFTDGEAEAQGGEMAC